MNTKWLHNYTAFIFHQIMGARENSADIAYWKDHLFASTLKYVTLLSLLAIIPGIYMGFSTGIFAFVYLNCGIIVVLHVIAMAPGISLFYRKISFCFLIYLAGFFLLLFLGNYGPGLLYLFAASIFSSIIFHSKYTYLPSWIITTISLILAVMIYFDFLPEGRTGEESLEKWLAVVVNLIFLSIVFGFTIKQLFYGLESYIVEKSKLEGNLALKSEDLEKSLAELKKKNEELEHFTQSTAHDLQEPLRMISSFVGLIKQKYASQFDEKGLTYLKFIEDGAKDMKNFIVQLLNYAQAGQQGSMGEVDTHLLVQELEKIFLRKIHLTGAKLEYHDLPIIFSNKILLRQVFQNLIENALNYTQEGIDPHVHIQYTEKKTGWEFLVKDNGKGIPKENLEDIFLMFKRLEPKRSHQGTGLGLSTVKKIIENLGGKIWAESTVQKGSCFYFFIPKPL